MKSDSRLSGLLHVLLHMAEHPKPMTSESLAKAMQTHPVVIRRIMVGLRERGYVRSEKGHGGGWTLEKELSQITLRDVYDALDRPTLLAMTNRTQAPQCLVEQVVNERLDSAFKQATELFLARLGEITLSQLREVFHGRLGAAGHSAHGNLEHVA